jgi:hypothetical protein
VDESEAVLRKLKGVRPEDTLLQGVYLPVADAAILLARDRSEQAVEALRRASQYELGTVAALAPVYLRADAKRRSGSALQAAEDFRLVGEHRGADPFSPFVPLSYLGAARALADAGSIADSRRAYEDLLRIWASADAEMPVLREARDELARLARADTAAR